MLNLETYLQNVSDETLLKVEDELLSCVVPATGTAHSVIRSINKQIDKGTMCINATTYRKVYMPTFAKAVHKEMARRYHKLFTKQGGHYVQSNSNRAV